MSIELKNIFYTYMTGTPFEKKALDGVSLEISKGEIVAVIGHTGSGKSTLVQHLNGLLKPSSGQVSIDGINLLGKDKAAKEVRKSVGMVFQYPEHQIFAETVYEDIAFGPRNRGFSEAEVEKQVKEAMAFVGLDYELYAKRSPFQLSGGQMRRVAIAGVVAMNPDYLVLDEPSAGLDPRSKNAVFKEIMALHKSRGIAIVLVTHSMEEAAKYAQRMLVVNRGKVLFDGAPTDIFRKHKQELIQVGMDEPQVFKLADLLRKGGLQLPEGITDELTLLQMIKKAKGWR